MTREQNVVQNRAGESRGQARGLAAIRGREWVAGMSEGRKVKVAVADVCVEREAKLRKAERAMRDFFQAPKRNLCGALCRS
jgi:hypothetical protein